MVSAAGAARPMRYTASSACVREWGPACGWLPRQALAGGAAHAQTPSGGC
jgi:hypothetical protein